MNSPVKFPENLQDVLPTNYAVNLAELELEQRQAIAEDFRRWRECKAVFSKRFGLTTAEQVTRADNEIRDWVLSLEPTAYREDMRRRLNQMKLRIKK